MQFGEVPVGTAEGALLVHSLRLGKTALKKGRILSAADIADITAAGIDEITVVCLEPGDVREDPAASRIAAAAAGPGVTTAPAFTARGAKLADTLLPGDDSTMSMPLKSKVSSASTLRMSSSPNETSRPTDCDEASATTLSAGNSRSARIDRNSRPTLPVAPTTATLKPIC